MRRTEMVESSSEIVLRFLTRSTKATVLVEERETLQSWEGGSVSNGKGKKTTRRTCAIWCWRLSVLRDMER